MTEGEQNSETKPRDRKLGDEWLDWKGAANQAELETDERLRTFLTLAAAAILIIVASIQLGWYLTKPRFEQISPSLSTVIEWSAFVLAIVLLAVIAVETVLLLKFRRSIFPYVWAERLLLFLLSKSMWLGEKFGISKDRVGNSFIKAHNLVVKSHASAVRADTLLVLLPRCLEKEARRQVIERANGRAVQVVTAGGGEEARKAIKNSRPSLIIAIACERDLISGIRDVAEKIPVLAIPNKRPEGPCKNTHFQLDDLDDALQFITDRTGKKAEDEKLGS
ncbi:MAG: hypothetical protein A4E57_02284 [Syntrophorhabdaceae bacterium PtaU1.Bin034]|nr:MAG: hypothetical protein A4E57_02284 [Syntrophorhabdaceae bacterium PtaU1.Bin034]